MPLPRFRRLDADKRSQLLGIAAKHFAEKGYESASLNEILAAAGFGKSSYYYYFEHKEDLFATVIGDFIERLTVESDPPDPATLTADTFWPSAEAWAKRSVELLSRYPDFVPLGRQMQFFWRSPSPRFLELITQADAKTKAALEVGRKLGCVRRDIDIDLLVIVARAADQALDEFLLRGWEHDIREHARLAFDTFRRLVETR